MNFSKLFNTLVLLFFFSISTLSVSAQFRYSANSANSVDITSFGAKTSNSAAQNDVAINTAIGDALVKKVRNLYVPKGNFSTTENINFSKICLIGEGVLTGLSVYNQPRNAQSQSSVYFNNLNGNIAQLQSAVNAGLVKAMIIGDSQSDLNQDGFDEIADMSSEIERNLKRQIGNSVNLKWYNRAVGGQAFATVNNVLPVTKTWQTSGKRWIEHIKDSLPDILYVAFGMNDSYNAGNPDSLITLVKYIKTWSKVPTLVFVTTPCPTTSLLYPDYSSKFYQDGRRHLSRFVQNFAEANGYCYYDVGRMQGILRDGIDVRDSYISAPSAPIAGDFFDLASTNCNFDKDVVDFKFSFYMNVDGGTFDPQAYGKAGRSIGIQMTCNGNDIVFIDRVKELTDTITTFTLYNGAQAQPIAIIKSKYHIPIGAIYFSVNRKGNRVEIIINDNEALTFDGYYSACNVPSRPKVTIYGNLAGVTANKHVVYGAIAYETKYQHYLPTITDRDMWGYADAAYGRKNPSLVLDGGEIGGNGVNHASDFGWKVWRKVIEMGNFGLHRHD